MIDQLHTLILITFCDQYAVAADRYLSSVQRDIDWYEASVPMGRFLIPSSSQRLVRVGGTAYKILDASSLLKDYFRRITRYSNDVSLLWESAVRIND
jgi:hypothetical protein